MELQGVCGTDVIWRNDELSRGSVPLPGTPPSLYIGGWVSGLRPGQVTIRIRKGLDRGPVSQL